MKTKPLQREHLGEFVSGYRSRNNSDERGTRLAVPPSSRTYRVVDIVQSTECLLISRLWMNLEKSVSPDWLTWTNIAFGG